MTLKLKIIVSNIIVDFDVIFIPDDVYFLDSHSKNISKAVHFCIDLYISNILTNTN